MKSTREHHGREVLCVGAGIATVFLASVACPAFDPEFGEIGVPEVRTVRDQAAQVDAIVELRLGQLLRSVMRSHGVDCWLILWRRGNPDPLLPLLIGGMSDPRGRAGLLFCESETGGSTRQAFGTVLASIGGAYEHIELADDNDLAVALAERVSAHEPRAIAINRSPDRPYADGLSASDEAWLRAALGPELAAHMVSSGPLVEDWLSRHLDVEAPLFSEAARLTVGILEQVLSDEFIVAAGTSVRDLTWAARQRATDMGLTVAIPPAVYLQRSSAVADARLPGGDVLLQTGDLVFLTVGVEYLGYVTHYGRWVYMLQEDEERAPDWVLRGLSDLADDMEGIAAQLHAGLGKGPMRDAVAGARDEPGADFLVLGRVGFFSDRDLVPGPASRSGTPDWLWRTGLPLQGGDLVAISLSRWQSDSRWREAGVWLTLVENAIVGPEGARLVVPPQREPFLID